MYENLNQEINNHLTYMIKQMEENLGHIDVLKQEVYFEMTREQIVDSFNKTLAKLKDWKKHIISQDYSIIKEEYKNLESTIAELELCLADNDSLFHMEGISYALYQIGKLLI